MKRVRWKIDLVILPMFLITQALQFMDKTSLNYANLFGYQKALGLKGQQFSFLSASTFSGNSHFFLWQDLLIITQWSTLATSSANIPVVGLLGAIQRRKSWLLAFFCGV
jgi:hypothetical protein